MNKQNGTKEKVLQVDNSFTEEKIRNHVKVSQWSLKSGTHLHYELVET